MPEFAAISSEKKGSFDVKVNYLKRTQANSGGIDCVA